MPPYRGNRGGGDKGNSNVPVDSWPAYLPRPVFIDSEGNPYTPKPFRTPTPVLESPSVPTPSEPAQSHAPRNTFKCMAEAEPKDDPRPLKVPKTPHFAKPEENIIFHIGHDENAKKIPVLKEAICENSPALKAVLDSGTMELDGDSFQIEEDCEAAFHFLLQWFYTNTLKFCPHDNATIESRTPEATIEHGKECSEASLDLVNLWVLADKLQIRIVQNKVVDQLFLMFRKCGISTRTINKIYECAAVGSPLRHLVVHFASWGLKASDLASLGPDCTHDFLVDLTVSYNVGLSSKAREKRLNLSLEEFYVTEEDS